ncbi:MAG: NUDIX hydrolase [Gammaproteobacteria bacterium]|nr:NUDIX hydrolase [Gammaproteobacteria bacterium]
MNYCSTCGEPVVYRVPPGDSRERYMCEHCTTVHYQNPRVVTGCLVTWQDQVLLCKRAIAPRRGYWTLPAGFLENGESAEAGALRETWEEARAQVELDDLYTLFSLPHISQIYMFYRARLTAPEYAAGEETEAIGLYREDQIPWSELAFPVVRETLEHYFHDRQRDHYPIRSRALIVDPARRRGWG